MFALFSFATWSIFSQGVMTPTSITYCLTFLSILLCNYYIVIQLQRYSFQYHVRLPFSV